MTKSTIFSWFLKKPSRCHYSTASCLLYRCIVIFAFCIPSLLFSQTSVSDKGIKWAEGLNWQQVKAKAKKENKYIFVDCFTTWCKPCKEMEMKVYTVDSVGDFFNKGFISVKLQMDATTNDNAEVKSWYKTANEMGSIYRIAAYPSYLFFAPNGEAVSKEIGYKDPGNFIQVARNAMDPSKQYLVLLKKYKQGQLDHAGTVSLIKMAQQMGDTADYRQILNSYYSYLRKQKKEKLYTKENIEFVASTLTKSNQLLFDMFYPNGKEVNKVMQNDWYAKKLVNKIIYSEKVQPFLDIYGGTTEPEWNDLYKSIAKSYGDDYAGRNILDAKENWYFSTNNQWLKYATVVNDRMDKYGTDTTDRGDDFRLNNKANWIWEHVGASTEFSDEIRKELSRTTAWMEGVVRRGATATGFRLEQWPLYIDTYANLLYKLGKTAEAIKWEEFAISKEKALGNDKGYIEYYEDCLSKMKKGEPNWPIEKK